MVDATTDTPQDDAAEDSPRKPKKRARKDAKRVAEARKDTLNALETLELALRKTAKDIKAARKLLARK